jgi:peptidoglycan/xylan/chitin deacetylase (PgdA/CDA1 family)
MCHGIRVEHEKPLGVERFDQRVAIASEMGFESIDYDDLAGWRAGSLSLPERPIMFDFDHPVKSMRYEVREILDNYGFKGNLFIYTRPYDESYTRMLPGEGKYEHMTWDEIGELRDGGWHIGAHTVSHPDLSELSIEDPTGEILRTELDRCNQTIQRNLGFTPRDFAFTATTWSSLAEEEVKKRYRFGRLWIISSQYMVDGNEMRYADLVGVAGPDEDDGGPPHAARYATE